MIHGGGVKRMNDLVNVFYTNAKSLQIFGRSPKLNLAQDQLQKEDIDIIAILEAGYRWNRLIEKQVKYQLRAIKGNTTISTSCVDDGEPGSLAGGTLTATVGGITGCVQDKGSDKQGRWSWVKLRGKNEAKLIIITGYRVCDSDVGGI